MKVLVINSGSSSIKYQLFDMQDKIVLASGLLEQIGERTTQLKHQTRLENGEMQTLVQNDPVADHIQGFDKIMDVFASTGTLKDSDVLYGIGHRVVHGGEAFHKPMLITDTVIETIREQIPLAPLHNPPNLLGIEVTVARRPEIPQVAVFDTAFQTDLRMLTSLLISNILHPNSMYFLASSSRGWPTPIATGLPYLSAASTVFLMAS